MDLSDFLWAIISDFVSLMSGIASVVLLILGALRKWANVPRPVLWTAAAVCFFFAAARVWTTEHRKYLTELERNKPQLAGGIVQCRFFPWPGEPNSSMIVIVASIKNTGAPSVAAAWTLSVTIPGDIKRQAEHMVAPEILQLLPTAIPRGQAIQYFPEDALYEKAVKAPIPTGGLISGHLLFKLNGIKCETVENPGTIVSLGFKDVLEKPYSDTKKLGTARRGEVTIPGLGRSGRIYRPVPTPKP